MMSTLVLIFWCFCHQIKNEAIKKRFRLLFPLLSILFHFTASLPSIFDQDDVHQRTSELCRRRLAPSGKSFQSEQKWWLLQGQRVNVLTVIRSFLLLHVQTGGCIHLVHLVHRRLESLQRPSVGARKHLQPTFKRTGAFTEPRLKRQQSALAGLSCLWFPLSQAGTVKRCTFICFGPPPHRPLPHFLTISNFSCLSWFELYFNFNRHN